MKRKKILFRADGNSNTGLGHLYRMFSLVEMLKDNYQYTFLTKQDSELIIFPKPYPINIIPNDIHINIEPDWIFRNYKPENYIIILDGYSFRTEYQKELKEKGFNLIYIDDLASFYMYANVVINHSIYVKSINYKAEPYTRFVLGSNYAMLRPLFIKEAKKTKKLQPIKHLLISFGGADFFDLTYQALLGAINSCYFDKINVLIGAAYHHQKIYEVKSNKTEVKIYKNLQEQELVDLMNSCDMAIIPASTISYEICSVKMLIVSGFYIDNQKLIYEGLKSNNIIFPADDFSGYNALDFQKLISLALKLSKKEKELMYNNQKLHFDGNQKERFLKIINSLSI